MTVGNPNEPTRWQENCRKLQWRVLRSSLPGFLELSSQILCTYLEDRVTASKLEVLYDGFSCDNRWISK